MGGARAQDGAIQQHKLICYLGVCAKVISQTPVCTNSTYMEIYACIDEREKKETYILALSGTLLPPSKAFANEK